MKNSQNSKNFFNFNKNYLNFKIKVKEKFQKFKKF